MSRVATYETLGEHFWAAFKATDSTRSWSSRGRCKTVAGTPDAPHDAWKVFKGDTVVLPSGKVKGEKLIQLALGHCEICPVQWDCARYAVEAGEQFCTWAMPVEDLRALQRRRDAVDVIEIARMENIAVQRAVAIVLRPPRRKRS